MWIINRWEITEDDSFLCISLCFILMLFIPMLFASYKLMIIAFLVDCSFIRVRSLSLFPLMFFTFSSVLLNINIDLIYFASNLLKYFILLSQKLFFLIFIFTLFYFTIVYWFYHTLTWIHHGCTWVPNPERPSHLPPHIISLDHPHAPAPSILYPVLNIDWHFVSYMIVYMFQCHSPRLFLK